MAFDLPVQGKITQNFGDRPEYYAQFGQLGHNGLDLGVGVGTPVYASEAGTVFYEGQGINQPWMGAVAGIVAIIDHGSVYTGYAHLKSTVVNRGQTVSKGQLIGYSGATGTVQGAHLHFEFIGKPVNIKNGYYGRVNPSGYLNQGDDMSKVTQDIARILAHGVAGRNGFDGRSNALSGADDGDLNKYHVNRETNEDILSWYTSKEGVTYREVTLPKVYSDRDTYKAQADSAATVIAAKDAEIKDLKAQLALAGSDTQGLNAFGESLRWLIGRLGLKK